MNPGRRFALAALQPACQGGSDGRVSGAGMKRGDLSKFRRDVARYFVESFRCWNSREPRSLFIMMTKGGIDPFPTRLLRRRGNESERSSIRRSGDFRVEPIPSSWKDSASPLSSKSPQFRRHDDLPNRPAFCPALSSNPAAHCRAGRDDHERPTRRSLHRERKNQPSPLRPATARVNSTPRRSSGPCHSMDTKLLPRAKAPPQAARSTAPAFSLSPLPAPPPTGAR